MKIPPGNRLHELERDRKGQFSISVNDQWRVGGRASAALPFLEVCPLFDPLGSHPRYHALLRKMKP